jgi:serine/threonine protein kinase
MPGDSDSRDALAKPSAALSPASLQGSGWFPIRELGRGGGGVVLLCAREQTIAAIDGYARATLAGGVRTGPQVAPASKANPSFEADRASTVGIERILIAARGQDGIAAVKVPHLATASAGDEERFRREVDATEQYVHPALIRFIDRDRRNPPQWFAMEYHARGNLSEPVNRAKYLGDPLTILSDIRPIADAIRLVHHGKAVHRDVKPKNIFVADGGNLVLGDFGIVVPAPEATRLTAIEPAHSRDWVPDWVQFGEERRYTTAVDVFALAKVMYYLLAGENVMASQLYREIEILRTKYSDTRAISPMLTLLEKCIVDREDKTVITDGAGLVKEIDNILTSEAARSSKQMLFSWVSSSAATDLALPYIGGSVDVNVAELPRMPRLSGIPVFIGRPTDRMIGRARLRGTGGTIQIAIGVATSERTRLPLSAGMADDTWTDEFVIRAPSPLPPGWHEVAVYAGGLDAHVSGLLLYAA